MKGFFIVLCFLFLWIASGISSDYNRSNPPFELSGEDASVRSGYNYLHVIMTNDQLSRLDVYDQNGDLVKVYYEESLKELYPSATYLNAEIDNDKLYLIFEEENGQIISKRIVVGARGSLSFMPERK
ncbi:hypothetical protein [Guptibacillus hwajinpoensis]|uniref:hypothetical protein n=1 Tax=Guptibacillus hwajinpoensis TaxID=208199 RepID=UPI001CFE1257|nr:hypothetical protein [Pseudalkalibacillus hwajinpoensis]WLR60076.1 hypothetical protein LC071_01390 [Pseudalkalibacillus hwajinpoensis]